MSKQHINKLLFAILIAFSFPALSADSDISSPSEIIKIMEESSINYKVSFLKEGEVSDEYFEGKVLIPDSYIDTDDSVPVIKKYEVSAVIMELFRKGDGYFINKEYDQAINVWQEALEKAPNYFHLFTMIGDAHYMKKDFIKAKDYFLKTLSQNPIDYQAHWFLANAYKKMGNDASAIEHIMLAHIYNRYHPEIFKTLKGYLEDQNLVWDEWHFIPQYQLEKIKEDIQIRASKNWLGYALVKALWKFEPNYPDTQRKSNLLLNPREEDEAILMHTSKEEDAVLLDVIHSKMFSAFFHYEIALRKFPDVYRSIPSDGVDDIVKYLWKYHIKSSEKNV